MVAIGTPILGDGKYAGADAHLQGLTLSRTVHLHARSIALPHPTGGGTLFVQAPLSPHLAETFAAFGFRSEEHTSELQSLMRISYAVFCLKKQKLATRYSP